VREPAAAAAVRAILAILCFAIALASVSFAFAHADRVAAAGGFGPIVAALVSFLVFGIVGFFLLLRLRDARKPALASGVPREPYLPESGLAAGVYGLIPGAKYRVIRPITDCYGASFEAGEELTFVSRDYLPYHGGHTLVFRPRTMYLQDDENAGVLHALDTYLANV
jgi:Domain of unknown function (DUF3601)